MFAWTLALILVICSGIVGYYVGALRTAFTTVALLLSIFLLKPMGALCGKLLTVVGISHPFLLALLGPLLFVIVLLVAMKVGAQAVHKLADNYYKYKSSDTERLLFERMNTRVGPCLGVLNGVLYVVLVSTLAIGLGYATVPLSRGDSDAFYVRYFNRLARDVEASGLSKAVGSFIPATPIYYDLVDVAAEWFHQPLVQGRLATYPPILPLQDRKDYQDLGNDVTVQQFILQRHTVGELLDHPKLGPVLSSQEAMDQALKAVGPDLKDLRNFLRTEKSEKYDGEPMLGRWDFNLPATVAENKKLRRMSGLEVNKMRAIFASQLEGSTLLAMLDNKIVVRRATQTGVTRREGTWKSEGGGKYELSFPISDDKKADLTITIEGRKFTSSLLGYQILFDR